MKPGENFKRQPAPAGNIQLANDYMTVIGSYSQSNKLYHIAFKQKAVIAGVRVDIQERYKRLRKFPRECDGMLTARTRRILRAIMTYGKQEAIEMAGSGSVRLFQNRFEA